MCVSFMEGHGCATLLTCFDAVYELCILPSVLVQRRHLQNSRSQSGRFKHRCLVQGVGKIRAVVVRIFHIHNRSGQVSPVRELLISDLEVKYKKQWEQ